jgi:protein O-GlcNAc transferase
MAMLDTANIDSVQFAVLNLKSKRQIDNAVELYEQHVAGKYDTPQAHFGLGVIFFYDKGLFGEAIREYREAIRLKPDWLLPILNLGIALTAIGQFDEALTQFQQIINNDPKFVTAYLEMGNTYQKSGKLEKAVQFYQESLHHDPECAEAYLCLAGALHKMQRPEEAISILHEVIEKLPNYWEARLELGNILYSLGHKGEAVSEWKQMLSVTQMFHQDGLLQEADYLLIAKTQQTIRDNM